MYELEVVLNTDGALITRCINGYTLEEIKEKETQLILDVAKENDLNGIILCASMITLDGEYVDSDEDEIEIEEDYSKFFIAV